MFRLNESHFTNPNKYSATKKRLLFEIFWSYEVGPTELSNSMLISRVSIHKHLKRLLMDKMIVKIGNSPKTIYRINSASPYNHSRINKITFEPGVNNYDHMSQEKFKWHLVERVEYLALIEFQKQESYLHEPDL